MKSAARLWLAVPLAIAIAAIAQRGGAQGDQRPDDQRCTAPADFVTQAICTTPALDELDRMLRSTYDALVTDSSPGVRDSVAAAETAWLAKRDACSDVGCLTAAYSDRNGALAAQLAKPDPATAVTLQGKFYGTVDRGEDETVLVVDDGTSAGAVHRQVRLAASQPAAGTERALSGLHVVVFDPASPLGKKITAACRKKCAITGTAQQTERDYWHFTAVTAAAPLADSFDFTSLPAQPSE
jgi:uncharacterized protein